MLESNSELSLPDISSKSLALYSIASYIWTDLLIYIWRKGIEMCFDAMMFAVVIIFGAYPDCQNLTAKDVIGIDLMSCYKIFHKRF